jgi:hypothetical protein
MASPSGVIDDSGVIHWTEAVFVRCDRCQQASDNDILHTVTLPVVPFQSAQYVERRICEACLVELRLWWFSATLPISNAPPSERNA